MFVYAQIRTFKKSCNNKCHAGEKNIHGNVDDALDRAREILGLPKLGRPKDFVPTVKREIKSI